MRKAGSRWRLPAPRHYITPGLVSVPESRVAPSIAAIPHRSPSDNLWPFRRIGPCSVRHHTCHRPGRRTRPHRSPSGSSPRFRRTALHRNRLHSDRTPQPSAWSHMRPSRQASCPPWHWEWRFPPSTANRAISPTAMTSISSQFLHGQVGGRAGMRRRSRSYTLWRRGAEAGAGMGNAVGCSGLLVKLGRLQARGEVGKKSDSGMGTQ